jgi:hypothetical protein
MSFAEFPEQEDGLDRFLAPYRDRITDDLTPPRFARCEICGNIVALFRGVIWSPGYPPTPHDQHQRKPDL